MMRTIAVAGSLSLLLWGGLLWLSHGIPGAPGDLANGFDPMQTEGEMPTVSYLGLHALLCQVLVVVLWRIHRSAGGESRGFWVAIGFAVAFRVVMIPSVPIHENDYYRYLWDGKVADAGINPYRFAPQDVIDFAIGKGEIPPDPFDPEDEPGKPFSEADRGALQVLNELRLRDSVAFYRMSHREVRTIYPPVAQGLFFVSNAVFGNSAAGLKFLIFVFDLGIIGVVTALLGALGRNRLWVLVYAWNPLVIKEFSNSAHYDALPVFFTMLAVLLAVKGRSAWRAALALAMGTLAKFFSAILLPILVPIRRESILAWCVFAVAIAVGFLPFFLWDDVGAKRLFGGLEVYSERWHYFGAVFFPVWLVTNFVAYFVDLGEGNQSGLIAAKTVCGLLLLSILAMIALRRSGNPCPARHAFVAVAALFLLSPTAFPWYFTWVLPFLCLFPSVAWIGLSFLLPLFYLDFLSEWELRLLRQTFLRIPILWWLVWVPFALLFVLERWRHSFFPAHHHPIAAGDDENRADDLEERERLGENDDAPDRGGDGEGHLD